MIVGSAEKSFFMHVRVLKMYIKPSRVLMKYTDNLPGLLCLIMRCLLGNMQDLISVSTKLFMLSQSFFTSFLSLLHCKGISLGSTLPKIEHKAELNKGNIILI